MNSPDIRFPAQRDLSLRRSPAGEYSSVDDRQATLAKAQCRLLQDLEELREREVNLRAYEERLRAMQNEMETGRHPASLKIPSPESSPLARTPGADEAWRKLHRARELLEVEQHHLQAERVVITEERETLRQREARVAERELRLKAVLERLHDQEEKPKPGLFGFTRAPFGLGKTAFKS